MKSRFGTWAALAGLAAALAFAATSATAQPANTITTFDASRSFELDVGVGKSQVLELPAPYTDVMVADPRIADVLPLNPHSVYVVGKAPGSTALTIYGPGQRLVGAANVVVSADIQGLKGRLAELLPGEKDISIRPANQSLVLSGTVSSPASMQRVMALAETYAPGKVVNMMGVEGTQQVMLSVHFVEMEHSIAKNLRVNINRSNRNPANGPPSGASGSGAPPYVSVFTGDTNVKNNGQLVDSFGIVSALYNGNLQVLLDALETKGVIRTLAEPTLVAQSGDTASFLAGGEFPIPVAQTNNGGQPTISIDYKSFGVSLAFTPTILKDGLMNIVANQEVSGIDPTISVNVGLITVPGIKVRRTHTTVELRDGESFTIAGLLLDDYQSQVRQFPFVGDIPILGALFKSNGYQRDQTELVVVVTPHLVTPRRGTIEGPGDRWVPPSDFERFLFGAQQAWSNKLKPEDKALLSADPARSGVEGPHGHVLY